MIREYLKRRIGTFENEARRKGPDHDVSPRRDLVGTAEDLLQPVALAAVVAKDQGLLPRAGGRTESRSQPGHVPIDDGWGDTRQRHCRARVGVHVDPAEAREPFFGFIGVHEEGLGPVGCVTFGLELVVETANVLPRTVELGRPIPLVEA